MFCLYHPGSQNSNFVHHRMPKQQRKNAFACSHSCLASQPNVQHLKETKMKQGTMNILFSILKTKLLKNGEAPILMRVTVSCTTRYCSPIRSTDRTSKAFEDKETRGIRSEQQHVGCPLLYDMLQNGGRKSLPTETMLS